MRFKFFKKLGFMIIGFFFIFPLWSESIKSLSFQDAIYYGPASRILTPLPRLTGEWLDHNHYGEIKDSKLWKINAKTGKKRLLINPQDHPIDKTLRNQMLWPRAHTPDRRYLVFSQKGDLLLYDCIQKKLTRILQTDTSGFKIPSISPDRSKIAFVVEGNLGYFDIKTNEIVWCTKDGSKDILNGRNSYIYLEEVYLGNPSGFWWSPDSQKIVFLRYDQTKVPRYPSLGSKGIYGTLSTQPYPKPGFPNPSVSLHVFNCQTRKNNHITPKREASGLLVYPQWSPDSNSLVYQRLNRIQNQLTFHEYIMASQVVRPLYREESKTWINFKNFSQFKYLKKGRLLLTSSKDGWYHLYKVTYPSRVSQISRGPWSVDLIHHVDNRHKYAYFTAYKEASTNLNLYRISLKSKKIKRLTRSPGYHEITMSPEGHFFIDRFSALNTPHSLKLYSIKGKLIRTLGVGDNDNYRSYPLGKKELFHVTTADGLKLPVIWYLPPDFNKNHKYPVIFKVYGGPESRSVTNDFDFNLYNYFLAQQGIIVLRADHRGAGHHGRKGMDLMYRQLGKWEMKDYTAVIKHLHSLPFIDPDRIGITGDSYGGYVTLLALTQQSQHFKYGAVGAGVTDWRLYNSIYTERYMDIPEANPEGYKAASVLSHVDHYQGGLLITHGTLDNNVHLQHPLRLIDHLIKREKPFQFIPFPDSRHVFSWRNYTRMLKIQINFWLQNFFNKKL